MRQGYRQEVLNVVLAQLLQERGIVNAPEYVMALLPEEGRRIPDILLDFQGLRTAIEGEVGDQPGAEERALASARDRVRQGIAHIGVAVIYPAELRQLPMRRLRERMASAALKVAVVTESPEIPFAPGDIDHLEQTLRHAFDELTHEDVVTSAVAVLDEGVEYFAKAVASKTGWVQEMAEILGIRELPKRARDEEEPE